MFIHSKRCNHGYNAGYTADGSQWARGPFLVLLCHDTERYPNGKRKLRAFVRRATLRQTGHFMMGSIVAKLNGADLSITVSGTYGSDGLPLDSSFRNNADKSIRYEDRPYIDLWPYAHDVPEELATALWTDTRGHNGPGGEELDLRAWAEKNIDMLRRWRREEKS